MFQTPPWIPGRVMQDLRFLKESNSDNQSLLFHFSSSFAPQVVYFTPSIRRMHEDLWSLRNNALKPNRWSFSHFYVPHENGIEVANKPIAKAKDVCIYVKQSFPEFTEFREIFKKHQLFLFYNSSKFHKPHLYAMYEKRYRNHTISTSN